jgi:hypothetical protein
MFIVGGTISWAATPVMIVFRRLGRRHDLGGSERCGPAGWLVGVRQEEVDTSFSLLLVKTRQFTSAPSRIRTSDSRFRNAGRLNWEAGQNGGTEKVGPCQGKIAPIGTLQWFAALRGAFSPLAS